MVEVQANPVLKQAQEKSLGTLTFYKASSIFKVNFTHDQYNDEIFRRQPHLLEF